MKVCFLSTVDFTRMTASTIYCDYLKRKNIAFDFIYVDRKGEQAENPYGAEHSYGFIPKSNLKWNFLVKFIIGYMPFRKYATEIIEKNKYDYIIVWNELTGFLFSDILRKRYTGKYCINIRDYQYFDNPFIQRRLDKAIVKSHFTTISSADYKQYFNHENVIPLYGTKMDGIESIERDGLNKHGPINILYIGQIGFLDYVYKMVDELGNDERYQLIFAGDGSDVIKDYAMSHEIRNVDTYGRFQPSDTLYYLSNGDILYNLYGTSSKHLSMAISIKYYYSLYMKIPILVFKGTAMAKMSEQSKTGFIIDENDFSEFGNRLYKWYSGLDFLELSNGCNEMLKHIEKLQNHVFDRLDVVLKK